MLGAVVALFLIFWLICFGIWYGANSALNGHSSIPPFMRPGLYWWAEHGITLPATMTTIIILILIPIGVYRMRQQRQWDEIDRMRRESDRNLEELRRRQEARQRNLQDMDSTEFERELRRRLRENEDLR